MFIKIPFESEITFKTNISEITKMSLEHDFNINESVVLGNFYVSGEYRSHEVSINVDPFNYTLPFSVDYPDNVIKDTLEFNIEDFSYEILNHNTLKVNIEYSLKAEIEDNIFERVDEGELESELAFIDDFLDNEKNNEIVKEVIEIPIVEDFKDLVETRSNVEILECQNEKEEICDEKEDIIINDSKIKMERAKEKIEEERLSEKEEKTIMETIKDSDDTFVTYHIHIMKESESIETISSIYNVPTSLIKEYNNTESITIGDKILIPKIDE